MVERKGTKVILKGEGERSLECRPTTAAVSTAISPAYLPFAGSPSLSLGLVLGRFCGFVNKHQAEFDPKGASHLSQQLCPGR